MPKSAGYVSPEYLRQSAELVARLKQETYRHLAIGAGARVLDLGCGPGMDTIPLARIVGDEGEVIGVDIDDDMIRQADQYARREQLQDRIQHLVGSAGALPFADAGFDACRAERLFQVLPDSLAPAAVLKELVRVLKPGGRIVLLDADWATASVDFADAELERRVIGFFARRMRPNGFAGRQFFKLLLDAGLADIRVESHPLIINDYNQTPFQQWLVGEAVGNEIATAEEMAHWLQTLTADHEQGRFFASVNMLLAYAYKH